MTIPLPSPDVDAMQYEIITPNNAAEAREIVSASLMVLFGQIKFYRNERKRAWNGAFVDHCHKEAVAALEWLATNPPAPTLSALSTSGQYADLIARLKVYASDWHTRAGSKAIVDEVIDVLSAAVPQSPTLQSADVVEALTPSAETKAAYIGEFHFHIPDRDEDGGEVSRRVTVPWTTIKEIMAAIRQRAALSTSTPVVEGVGTTTSPRTDEVISTKQEAR